MSTAVDSTCAPTVEISIRDAGLPSTECLDLAGDPVRGARRVPRWSVVVPARQAGLRQGRSGCSRVSATLGSARRRMRSKAREVAVRRNHEDFGLLQVRIGLDAVDERRSAQGAGEDCDQSATSAGFRFVMARARGVLPRL